MLRAVKRLGDNRVILYMVIAYQRVALVVAYWLYPLRPWRVRTRTISWVVGPDELASMVIQISRVVPDSYSVAYIQEAAYDHGYDHRFRTPAGSAWRWIARTFTAPFLLARLTHRADGFIYVGSAGFLQELIDQRRFEFAFLKKHGKAIVCYWCGSDIRSTKLMHELQAQSGQPNISTYIGLVNPILESAEYDRIKKQLAGVADRYSDAQYSFLWDQSSYLTMPTETFLYILPEDDTVDPNKFVKPERLVVVHASTSPMIKGTPLVRAAIDKLRNEGYDFEYVELIGVPNATVKSELARAHIALNQFYGFTPAVFGAEALMRKCVVMMSSDERVETDLPDGSHHAWVVTRHFEVYDKLKHLLNHPNGLEEIAARGQEWAREHASLDGAGRRLNGVLDAVLAGTYQPPTKGGKRA